MSEENIVIELLSDSDEEISTNHVGKVIGSSDQFNRKVKALDTDEVAILSCAETRGIKSESDERNPIRSQDVRNPYAKKNARHTSHSATTNYPDKSEKNVSSNAIVDNPYIKKQKVSKTKSGAEPKLGKKRIKHSTSLQTTNHTELQAGLVFGEDDNHVPFATIHKKRCIKQASLTSETRLFNSRSDEEDEEIPLSAEAYARKQIITRISNNLQPILYHDPEFIAGNPATIDGIHVINKNSKNIDADQSVQNDVFVIPPAPKCRCRPAKPCTLAYSTKGQNNGRPYYKCQHNSCKYFSWAFTSYMLHWYRFGEHNGHVLVQPGRGFRAEDLVQGKVGDCWFLSALAVVAERADLIGRLIGPNSSIECDNFGVIDVTLFVDGYWKKIVMDNFLPCFIDVTAEKRKLKQNVIESRMSPCSMALVQSSNNCERVSSRFDLNNMADECISTLHEIGEFLHFDRFNKDPSYRFSASAKKGRSVTLNRRITVSDLAYSKAKLNQLWVPFIEKAYAKMHGCYRAISGGHIAEAFLDLTGAPTAVYNFDHHDFNAKAFWGELMTYRRKRLPMGCGTSSSSQGIVGMHAYSILDVREVKNVGAEFFYDKIVQGTLGNVSGFTDLDGTVRLLRIRNPHGQGEWKGEFSDKSDAWQRLLTHKNQADNSKYVDLTKPMSPELKRTMQNDGTFWIGYDDFLLGFSNVDVVLAFQGNHAKSFGSTFATKLSNHRNNKAFELSAVERQPGESETDDEVEVYIMCIQKTRRGASHGRSDRRKSYKGCDIGILVGEVKTDAINQDVVELDAVDGRFFGLSRHGHIRLVLNKSHIEAKMIVMPVSFGHPTATDDELSFVVRFVSDAPLLVRELELAKSPKIHIAIQKFCFGSKIMSLGVAGTSHHRGTHGQNTVVFERKLGGNHLFRIIRIDCLAGGGGTVLFYLTVNDTIASLMTQSQHEDTMSFSLEVNCRGMICRTANGLEKHEVISKGEKFQAAWRRFSMEFASERKSRLLCALVQSGEDYQVGSIKCVPVSSSKTVTVDTSIQTKLHTVTYKYDNYSKYGIFASLKSPLELQPFIHSGLAKPVIIESNIDDELSIALQRSREEYRARHLSGNDNSVIALCDSSDENENTANGNLDAAILASMKDSNSQLTTNASNGEDEDLKAAIKLSLNAHRES